MTNDKLSDYVLIFSGTYDNKAAVAICGFVDLYSVFNESECCGLNTLALAVKDAIDVSDYVANFLIPFRKS